MLRVNIQVAPVKRIVVLIAAGKVEFRLAEEFPAVLRLRRIELYAKERILHGECRAAAPVPLYEVGDGVGIHRMGIVNALERKITVRNDLQSRFAERFEDIGELVGQKILPPRFGREDIAGFVRRRSALHAQRDFCRVTFNRLLPGGGTAAPFELGDPRRLRFVLRFKFRQPFHDRLKIGLGDRFGGGQFRTQQKHQRCSGYGQKFFH